MNFHIKKFTALHKPLYEMTVRVLNGEDKLSSSFTTGKTFLIKKDPSKSGPGNYRPITCQPTLTKLITSVAKEEMYYYCERYNLLHENQLGVVRGTEGASLSKAIHKVCPDLKVAWLDLAKAFDTVPHSLLLKILRIKGFPERIVQLVSHILGNTKLELYLGRDSIEIATVERGIIQGDSLSPLLFVLVVDVLMCFLEKKFDKIEFGTRVGTYSVNCLAFMDDLKFVGPGEEIVEKMLGSAVEFFEALGMSINPTKSATNFKLGLEGYGQINANDFYHYLGIVEGEEGLRSKETKGKVIEKVIARATYIADSKLYARNAVTAFNEFVITPLVYILGLADFSFKELSDLDDRLRSILTTTGKFRLGTGTVQGFYLSVRKNGFGIKSVLELGAKILLAKR